MRSNKVNPVFISPDDQGRKPFCSICGVHHQLFGNRYRCPQCGTSATTDEAGKVDRKILVADNPEPMVATRKDPKKKRDPDFPPNAQIIEDREIEP